MRGPSLPAEPLEVGDRVDVIYEIRGVHLPGRPERGEARRAAGAVDRREEDGRGERERIRGSVGRRREGEPVVGHGAGERQQVAGRHAREVGVDDEERPDAAGRQRRGLEPCAYRGALPAAGIGDERRVADGRARAGRRRRSVRRRCRRASTSSSIADASAVRAPRGSGPSRLLPFAPRKGTTSDGIRPDTSARMPGERARGRGAPWCECRGRADQAASAPGERSIHSRRSNQCEARRAAATAGSVCSA